MLNSSVVCKTVCATVALVWWHRCAVQLLAKLLADLANALCRVQAPLEAPGRGFTHEYCTPFELWTLTPITPGLNFLLVGEKDKYVALSPQRFSDYSANQAVVGHPGHLKATVKGSPGEKVTVEAASELLGWMLQNAARELRIDHFR